MRLLILFSLLLFTGIVYSQNNQGEILYEEKVDAYRNLPAEMEIYKDRIPQFRTTNRILYFNPEEAYYITQKDESRLNEVSDRQRRGRRFMGRRQNQKLYINIAEKTTKEERDFFGKKFLVEGKPRTIPWKFTGKQKQVGSFLCQEAAFQDSTEQIIAWFTPMIPVAAGPGNYANLPGMILHIDVNNGERIITAVDIQLKELESEVIIQPTEGERISQVEFRKLVDQKTKEMEAEFGGDRGRFWRMRRNRN